MSIFNTQSPGVWINIKMPSCQYRKSHCGDKIVRPSYLHNGISYTGKTISLYWIGAQSSMYDVADVVVDVDFKQATWFILQKVALSRGECVNPELICQWAGATSALRTMPLESVLVLFRQRPGPVSISDKTSYRKISQRIEAARFVFRIVRSLWNLAGTSTALLPWCQSNIKAIRIF